MLYIIDGLEIVVTGESAELLALVGLLTIEGYEGTIDLKREEVCIPCDAYPETEAAYIADMLDPHGLTLEPETEDAWEGYIYDEEEVLFNYAPLQLKQGEDPYVKSVAGGGQNVYSIPAYTRQLQLPLFEEVTW